MSVSTVDTGPRKVTRSVEVDRPAAELFAMVADPHRHGELDGSGTVRDATKGPDRLTKGDKFSVKMKMFGLPYRITSTATEILPDQVVEWQHPGGHRWRWEFEALTPTRTKVTETFDYSTINGAQAKAFEVMGMVKKNGVGITKTLEKLAG
ncbi:MAG: SRPBCC family protein [Jatrophihabitans sp.]